MDYPEAKKYPAFLNLEGRNVLLIGGGNVAWEKLPNLVKAFANITVIASDFIPVVKYFLDTNPQILWEKREIKYSDLDGRDLIFSATNNKDLNRKLGEEAHRRKIWINSCDDPENCDFYSSAVFDKGPIRIAVSTDGKFAGLGGLMKNRLREIMDEYLPDEHSDLWEEILKTRQALKTKIGNLEERKEILIKLLHDIRTQYWKEDNRK